MAACRAMLSRVYPRVCGGTFPAAAGYEGYEGLSPRVRGNPQPTMVRNAPLRSIPACAGEPRLAQATPHSEGVYPRVCGGTPPPPARRPAQAGLSPRVRGNLASPILTAGMRRSIPACAGEPYGAGMGLASPMVYPRVCGGTPAAAQRERTDRGLSPRVRGNPPAHAATAPPTGSIPACAGEPCPAADAVSASKVYPRVCGGTLGSFCPQKRRYGLSPRVRGNPERRRFHLLQLRSIPACAGEPPFLAFGPQVSQVYPRVCGGTSCGKCPSPG